VIVTPAAPRHQFHTALIVAAAADGRLFGLRTASDVWLVLCMAVPSQGQALCERLLRATGLAGRARAVAAEWPP
jgi:hypothetical protein